MQTKRGRIPGGDFVVMCAHIQLGKRNHRVIVVPIKDALQEMPGIERTVENAAKTQWMFLCPPCAQKGDAEAGAPYTFLQLPHDVNIT